MYNMISGEFSNLNSGNFFTDILHRILIEIGDIIWLIGLFVNHQNTGPKFYVESILWFKLMGNSCENL